VKLENLFERRENDNNSQCLKEYRNTSFTPLFSVKMVNCYLVVFRRWFIHRIDIQIPLVTKQLSVSLSS